MEKNYRQYYSLVFAVLVSTVLISGCSMWSGSINLMMPADSRPGRAEFAVNKVTPLEFDTIASQLSKDFSYRFNHIEQFRKANLLGYEGPGTCLRCHEKITVQDAVSGKEKKVDLMDNITSSAHYRFFTKNHPNVYGFNGHLADDFPMGKINRPCPKPGSFAMTAWAELVITKKGKTLSEGCGQCHIGSQYQAPLGEMMPFYSTLAREKETIDCLICHAAAYDMNKKQVIAGDAGRLRWDQDRSLKAALSVIRPTAQNCLRCHQHNMGGDIYIDPEDPSYMQSTQNLGHERPRIRHPGSKRGTPYSPSWDVHAAAGLSCIDCHLAEGHLMARGTHTTTIMANDLPNVEVSCEKCHTAEPHKSNRELADYLNGHTATIACQTCHIPSLHPDNATLRDFSNPVFEEDPGIYLYHDLKKDTEPGKGIVYVWWNGDASFLGNPIGDNPNGANLYRFYKPAHIWPEFTGFDYQAWYETVMRPIARQGRASKIYPMKLFNGKQHIDLQNIGPFGGMYVPYNLPAYYAYGKPDLAASKEMEKSMMNRLYGWMFDLYLMNKFMTFMDDGSGKYLPGWNTRSYQDVLTMARGKVEARWIPQDACLEISHAIRRNGALSCADCHRPDGVLDWKDLGYTREEIRTLTQNPLE
ncbi:MAG: nitrite reductase [bacterium]